MWYEADKPRRGTGRNYMEKEGAPCSGQVEGKYRIRTTKGAGWPGRALGFKAASDDGIGSCVNKDDLMKSERKLRVHHNK